MRELSPKFINAMGVFATLVGLSSVVAEMSDIRFLQTFASTFMISPAPSPFNRVAHAETDHPHLACEQADGRVIHAQWNASMRNAIPGPHRRGLLLLDYFAFAWRSFKSHESRRLNTLTRYYFCENGDLARAAGCEVPPRAIVFEGLPANRLAATSQATPSMDTPRADAEDEAKTPPASEEQIRVTCSP